MKKVFRPILFICLTAISMVGFGQLKDTTAIKQQLAYDSLSPIQLMLNEVVVSATKTKMQLGSTTVPVTLVKASTINHTNALRLNDVLSETTGLNTVASALGTGIQMQGLDADYTLIMVDGIPLIGRLNGTIDLSRISVDNIDRIEIVKGPSSVLFGSNAMAGVINIITKSPTNKKTLDLSLKMSSFKTQTYALGGSYANKKLQSSFSANYYTTGGYDLASNYQGYNISTDYYGKTVSPHHNYSLSLHNQLLLTPQLKLHLDGRYFQEGVSYKFQNSNDSLIDGAGILTDWSLRPWFEWQLTSKWKSKLSYSYNQYKTDTQEEYLDNSLFSHSFFNEIYSVVETQNDYKISKKHTVTLGGGYELESVQTNRLFDESAQLASNKYLYFQYLYKYKNKVDFVLGTRFENHQNYLSQFNPKISLKYEINPNYVIKASVGRGFKKPDFKQLYFNYTNNAIGYTVLGTKYVSQGMADLLANNEIAINPEDGTPVIYDLYYQILENDGRIDAESSVGYNLSFSVRSINNTIIDFNFFRNDLKNLIETSPIALKNNGWQAYSYQNINRVFTQGAEVEIKHYLSDNIVVNAGYQFLIAKDKKIVEQLEAGQIFGVNPNTGSSYKVTPEQYGGLLNRPRHSANIKLDIKEFWKKINANFRLVYRGRYGFADLNNNQILDTEKEYVPGYFLLNATLSKTFMQKRLAAKVGVDNMLNYTYSTPEFTISSLPGRIYYISLTYKINKK